MVDLSTKHYVDYKIKESIDDKHKVLVTLANWRTWINNEHSKCGDANVAIDLAKELNKRNMLVNPIKDGKISIPVIMNQILGESYGLSNLTRMSNAFEELYPGFTLQFVDLLSDTTSFNKPFDPILCFSFKEFDKINGYEDFAEYELWQIGYDTRSDDFDDKYFHLYKDFMKVHSWSHERLRLFNVYRDTNRWLSEILTNQPCQHLQTLSHFTDIICHYHGYNEECANSLFRKNNCIKFKSFGELVFYKHFDKNEIKSDSPESAIYFGRPKSNIIKNLIDEDFAESIKDYLQNHKFILMTNFGNNPKALKKLLKTYDISYYNLKDIKYKQQINEIYNQSSNFIIFDGYYNLDKEIEQFIIKKFNSKYYLRLDKVINHRTKDCPEAYSEPLEYADLEALDFGMELVDDLQIDEYDQIQYTKVDYYSDYKSLYSVEKYMDRLLADESHA